MTQEYIKSDHQFPRTHLHTWKYSEERSSVYPLNMSPVQYTAPLMEHHTKFKVSVITFKATHSQL